MSITPLYIVEEWSAKCFAGCPNCFRTFVKGPLDGHMSREIFEAANKGIPRQTMILPQFHGESLLNPDFPYFLERCRDLGLRVSMPVSGSAGERFLPTMVSKDSPIYILIMSIDGESDHSQSVRRGNISLERVTRFTKEAIRLRGDLLKPWISVRWVEGGQSEVEFERYLKHWLFDVGVDFVLRSRLFNYGSTFNSSPELGFHKCRSLIEGNPVVLFNGDVLLCERVTDREKYVIGNVLKDDWDTILARRDSMVGDYPHREPCRLCSAAYLLTGFKGILELRHGQEQYGKPIYVHSDHSQTFYSLSRQWSGINWSLGEENRLGLDSYSAYPKDVK